jgi:hypothetical protein
MNCDGQVISESEAIEAARRMGRTNLGEMFSGKVLKIRSVLGN